MAKNVSKMEKIDMRCVAAFVCWLLGLFLFLAGSIWSVHQASRAADDRLIDDAARLSSQLASLLSLPAWELDELSARSIVFAAMDNEGIYGIKVEAGQRILEGQRRNYQWEIIPWDGELTEDTVQGRSPLKMEDRELGSVEVYLSQRRLVEEKSSLLQVEMVRFMCSAIFCTAVFLLALWHFGLPRRLLPRVIALFGHGDRHLKKDIAEYENVCLPASARKYFADVQDMGKADAYVTWCVIAGLFREVFIHAPELMSRLCANGELAALCRLGRLLELAAVSLKALPLAEAARNMQVLLNDPQAEGQALAVESCIVALRDVLEALVVVK